MSEPFLGEIMIVAFNFAQRGFAQCDGQILPINQNQSLFSLLGTMYGGDGRTDFALPELRGRSPIHRGNGFTQGNRDGEEDVFLSVNEIPSHQHAAVGIKEAAEEQTPEETFPAMAESNTYAVTTASPVNMHLATTNGGGGQGHNNMQPYLALNFVIALQGLFPSRN